MKAKVFRPVHAEFVAESVGILIDGIMHGQLLDRTGLSSGDAYHELSTLVLHAMAVDSDSAAVRSPGARASRRSSPG